VTQPQVAKSAFEVMVIAACALAGVFVAKAGAAKAADSAIVMMVSMTTNGRRMYGSLHSRPGGPVPPVLCRVCFGCTR
jgi:hypothetical protein